MCQDLATGGNVAFKQESDCLTIHFTSVLRDKLMNDVCL